MPLRFHVAILVPLPDDLPLELREGEEDLGAMVDAGSASAHRGWTPTTDDLDALMSNPEHFVERAFIAPDTKSGPMRCNARQRAVLPPGVVKSARCDMSVCALIQKA
jgi:hypothetical protein